MHDGTVKLGIFQVHIPLLQTGPQTGKNPE